MSDQLPYWGLNQWGNIIMILIILLLYMLVCVLVVEYRSSVGKLFSVLVLAFSCLVMVSCHTEGIHSESYNQTESNSLPKTWLKLIITLCKSDIPINKARSELYESLSMANKLEKSAILSCVADIGTLSPNQSEIDRAYLFLNKICGNVRIARDYLYQKRNRIVFYLLSASYDANNPLPWARLAVLTERNDYESLHSFSIEKLKTIDGNNSLAYYIDAFDSSLIDINKSIQLILDGNSKPGIDFYITPIPEEADGSSARTDDFHIMNIFGIIKTLRDAKYIADTSVNGNVEDVRGTIFILFRDLTRRIIAHANDLIDKGDHSGGIIAYEASIDMARRIALSRPPRIIWIATGLGILREKQLLQNLHRLYLEKQMYDKAEKAKLLESVCEDALVNLSNIGNDLSRFQLLKVILMRRRTYQFEIEKTKSLRASLVRTWCFDIACCGH